MTDVTPIEGTRSWFLGLTVVLLYAVFVSAVFSGFATYIYRSEWQATLATGDEIADIDNLIYTIRRERLLETAIGQDRRAANVLSEEKSEFVVQRDRAFGDIAVVNRDRKTSAFHEVASVRNVDDALAPDDQIALDKVLNDNARTVEDRADNALLILTAALQDMSLEKADRVMPVITAMQESREILDQRNAKHAELARAAKAELVQLDDKLALISSTNDSRTAQLAALRGRLDLASPDRARFEALYINVPFFGDIFQRLVSFPTIFLTLIVTMAAGGLGTVVSFSRRFYAQDEQPSLARLFVNVGEGIAAAIAIFLFSGAGMLALTQGAGAQNTVELSPYTVAFVAFLSGFMAEEAFGSIHAAGKRIFKREEEAGEEAKAQKEVPAPG